jgi:hypothetical protein
MNKNYSNIQIPQRHEQAYFNHRDTKTQSQIQENWIPACAGMTDRMYHESTKTRNRAGLTEMTDRPIVIPHLMQNPERILTTDTHQ